MELEQLLSLVDNFGILVLALYIIQKGMDQMNMLNQQYNGFVQTVLVQQQSNNEQLASLVEKLCQK